MIKGQLFPSMTPALRQTCLFWRQKYVAHEISVEMVHMEKSRPSKNAQIYLKTTLACHIMKMGTFYQQIVWEFEA